ncbi:LysM peptidoglycan-binding domain-containing protein [Tellurirhabdus rosea]|uniref:LysM peptidoglycan-binding domain-containing protein n=1 Tax=Tellurirhabdus rosea TaxID=2674997 RepID=UPI0022528EE4|nr:LysM peptidoglycan-binding domain-containing protein [Tellurirhabdus rosea]
MKRLLLVLIGATALTTAGATPSPSPVDSIGVEKKDGKLYVLHRVGEGQTLYSLVRRYKTSVQAIRDANPGLTDNVRYDQLVRVPVTSIARRDEKAIEKALKKEEKAIQKENREVAKADKREEKAIQKDVRRTEVASDLKEKQADRIEKREKTADRRPENPNGGIHQVESGQTLYSLANRYGVSMDELRRWNNLSADRVVAGQPLIVSEKAWRERTPSVKNTVAKTTTAPAKPESTQVTPPRVVRPDVSKPASEKSEAARTRPAEEVASADKPRTEAPRPESGRTGEPEASASAEPRVIRPGDTNPLPNAGTNARRISEIGIAELIDQSDNTNKYLALHRTAPIGTLVLVRNAMNNQSIWVKVIGRLPDTSINDRVVIKISARAFEKLSPADRRFRAEVSYLLQ